MGLGSAERKEHAVLCDASHAPPRWTKNSGLGIESALERVMGGGRSGLHETLVISKDMRACVLPQVVEIRSFERGRWNIGSGT